MRVERDYKLGLTNGEAKRRLLKYGYNTPVPVHHLSCIKEYLMRFKNPLVIVLVVAAILSLYMGEVASAVTVLVIVFISTTLDFINTFRSERAAQALQRTVRVSATVLRSGKPRKVPVANLVPGDVVIVSSGSLIPADGAVLESDGMAVDESAITGESFPVIKSVKDQVKMGSNVTSGSGCVLLQQTGAHTEFAQIAKSLNRNKVTEFDIEIARLSVMLTRITFGLVLMIVVINIIFHRDMTSSILFAIALAVGMTPELLPLIITINLTKGSLRMAKKGVIVKKLSAMQNFGSMDILCTDKTGTLTESKIAVAKTQNYYGNDAPRLLQLAAFVSNNSRSFNSPLDDAVVKCAPADLDGYVMQREIPFDFQRRRESVLAKLNSGDYQLITKGAADSMLKIVKYYRDNNGEARRLTKAGLDGLMQDCTNLSKQGYRTLMVATRDFDTADIALEDESEMVFEGFIAFEDPPKASAAKSLKALASNGIAVKIVTGDDPLVATKIAESLGLTVKGVLTGDQISKLNSVKLRRRVDKTTIFARVNPSQKLAVIEALRHAGHVVGYMGDGINDAPALRIADIGISVNNAVDVAKQTADLILLGKSLRYLNDGVVEGRRTFANTMKYLKMSLSSNFGNMFSMAGASLVLPFLPMTASQILLNNLLYDTSQFAIPSDNVDRAQLTQPRRMDLKSLKKFMWLFGIASSLFDFITFAILLGIFKSDAAQFQTCWFIESLLTQILVVFIIRSHKWSLSSRPSLPLIGSIGCIAALAIAVVYTTIGSWFGFIIPEWHLSLAIAGIVAGYLVVIELLKRLFYRFNSTSI